MNELTRVAQCKAGALTILGAEPLSSEEHLHLGVGGGEEGWGRRLPVTENVDAGSRRLVTLADNK